MKPGKKSAVVFIAAITLVLFSCKRESLDHTLRDSQQVPRLPEQLEDFPASHNDYLATLGKVLFYDKELSINKNISCGSCHKQEHAFTDNLRFSPGTNAIHTKRNTPSIFSRDGRLFWDGRSFSLTDLVLRPVRDEVEMGFSNIPLLVQRISALDYYKHLFQKAFPGNSDIDSNKISTALAEFLRNFNFSETRFHKSRSTGEPLNPSEQLGESLFFGKALCSNCHHVVAGFGPATGGYGNTNESHNIGLDIDNPDPGVGAITQRPEDQGAFMMPVLLNVALTAPYMHDGRFATLEEVVEHYNSDIKPNPNLSRFLREFQTPGGNPVKLNLTEEEKQGLVDFLKTLTDPTVQSDPKFRNPFVSRRS